MHFSPLIGNKMKQLHIRGQRNVAFVRFLRFFLILTSGFLKNFQDFLRWKSGFLMLFQKIPAFGILAGIFVFISTCTQFVHKVCNQGLEIVSRILHNLLRAIVYKMYQSVQQKSIAFCKASIWVHRCSLFYGSYRGNDFSSRSPQRVALSFSRHIFFLFFEAGHSLFFAARRSLF